jgi:tetratricopeptide (TPR) repeat protein
MPRVYAAIALLLASIFSMSPVLRGQSTEDSYKAERGIAMDYFRQQKMLEALPLFEDLAKKNPDDAGVLTGLGLCLVRHSGTLADAEAGMKERVRARAIMTRAKQLGSTNGVMLNLLDLIPLDGSVGHDPNPEVDKAFQAGETAFAKRDFDEAIKNYSKALELDPKNYSSVLFIGDSYFALKDFPKALEWYDRAIALNPNGETAYRYEADMLTKNGEMEKARTRAIQAVVADPYNAIPWRGLQQWATVNKLQLHAVHINTHSNVDANGKSGTNITLDLSSLAPGGNAWIVYAGARADWRRKKFQEAYPLEPQYRHSLAEETEALSAAASVLDESLAKTSGKPADADLLLLQSIAAAKMLEPYILFNAADQGIAKDYVAYRETHRPQLEEYLSRFVVPPAPTKP